MLPKRGRAVYVNGPLRPKSVLPALHTDLSQNTKREVLTKLRRSYVRAGALWNGQLLEQTVSLFGYHRKAAIRALRAGRPPR